MTEYAEKILLGVYAILLIVPPVLALFSVVAENVWFRGKKEFNLAYGWQKLLFKRLNDLIIGENDWEKGTERGGRTFSTCASYILYIVAGGLILLVFPAKLISNGHFEQTIIILLGIAAFLFIPMICVDIYKALRYNLKTGKVAEVDQLKEDIAELKKKLEKK